MELIEISQKRSRMKSSVPIEESEDIDESLEGTDHDNSFEEVSDEETSD